MGGATNGAAGEEDDGWEVLLSAIEHYSYCPRQCGLIHIEQSYDENQFTVRGVQAHERVDSGEEGLVGGVPVSRSIPLWSVVYGLRGKADVVEFRADGPYPVEYKVGGRRSGHADLQLCAQALCLEEMTGKAIARGAIFYFGSRRRQEVLFTPDLRSSTLAIIQAMQRVVALGVIPPHTEQRARCQGCSLYEVCLPQETQFLLAGAKVKG